jgi:membrane protease YdiL (CAAX protease family)
MERNRPLEFTPLVLGFAVALAIGLPLLAFRTGLREEHVEEVTRARSAVYFSAAVSITVLAGVTFGISAWQGIAPAAVGWKVGGAGAAFAWAVVVAGAGLAAVWIVVRVGQTLKLPESRLSLVLMPRTSREKRAFLLVAAAAALGEEYLYRGFMYHVFAETLGGPWTAAVVTSVSFGVAHGYQRTVGMVRAALLGVLLAIPVIWTGSLFPSIVAHFWINAAVGLGGWKHLFPDIAAAEASVVSDDWGQGT